ncbi:MAG: hypothetical protein EAZ55_12960 [Cytophagales bacterium]|nr:MAG: hypothetical protein EAZ55_12960 [Cytophagales bacterium]
MSKLTIKNTKEQILKAYNELLREKSQQDLQIRNLEKSLSQTKNTPEAVKVEEKIITKIIEKPANINNIGGIINTLQNIEQGIGVATGEISHQIVGEADTLAQIQQKIEEAKKQLLTLHQIEEKDAAVENIIDIFTIKQNEFTKEFNQFKNQLKTLLEQKQKEWETEQTKHHEQNKEQYEQDQREQKREIEQYHYDLQLSRNLERDVYEQKKIQLQQNHNDIREQKENFWAEREKALKERENTFEDYKNRAESLPEKLEKETKRAEAEGKAIAEKDTRNKNEMMQKEADNQLRMYEQKVKALEDNTTKNEQQIILLNRQLENALKQVQDLAIKAMESSARNDTLTAIREIAVEQAKNQPKGK